jgi:hypothetical protein
MLALEFTCDFHQLDYGSLEVSLSGSHSLRALLIKFHWLTQ